jgi:hypothetical protein
MGTGSRMPRGIEDFNSYIVNTTAYLTAGTPTTNADRLGVLPAETAQWVSLHAEWVPLYVKYDDKRNSRTTAVKDQLLNIIDRCVDLDQDNHLLDRIAASPNVTITDLGVFNIRKGMLQKSTRTTPQTIISEPVIASLQPQGGGSVLVKCYSTTGERACIFDDADSVQFLYIVGDTPPASAEVEGLNRDLSTKATFTLSLGAGKAGKHLYIYFRWYNTKYPALAGPWSVLQTTLIL